MHITIERIGTHGASMKESRSLTAAPQVRTTRAMPGPTTGENIRFFFSFLPAITQVWAFAKLSVLLYVAPAHAVTQFRPSKQHAVKASRRDYAESRILTRAYLRR